MDVNEWMVSEKIAKNISHAYNIFNGLELYKINDDDERMARCRLYREWRNAGENRNAAFEAAIAGKAAPARLEDAPEHCTQSGCGDFGWYMIVTSSGESKLIECEFCNTNPKSYYNVTKNRKGK